MSDDDPRILVNEAGTVLVTMWPDGLVTVAFRDNPGDSWGPPVLLEDA
jgi:hypothetical protein